MNNSVPLEALFKNVKITFHDKCNMYPMLFIVAMHSHKLFTHLYRRTNWDLAFHVAKTL